MQLTRQTFLLFGLNLLDAILTIYWVHYGFASEGNILMAKFLDVGYAPFLAVKITVGAIASIVLWHWGNLRLARYGLIFALIVYISLMGVHFVTGLSAFGFLPDALVNESTAWSNRFFAFFN